MKQIPRTTPTQVDSLVPDSGLIGTDSLNIPDPREYSISEVFIYIWDLLQVQLFTLQNTPVTFMKLLVFVLLLVGFSYLASIIKGVLNKKILPRFAMDSGLRYTLSRISQYVIVVIGVFISFQFLGIDMTGLAVVFGFLSVGIGFGLQNVTSNFISGLIVLFERPISVGDRVMVNNIEGDVIEINIRATKIRTLDNISIIVPNSESVFTSVINYSHGDPTYRLGIEVGVSYSSDLDMVLKALKEVAEENKNVLKSPKYDIQFKAFGESSWDMKLLVWIADVKNYPRIRTEINKAIVRKFREYEIEIPFPQRDLHVRSGLNPKKETRHGSEDSKTSEKEDGED